MSENGSLNGTAGGPADAGPSSPNKLLSPRETDNHDSPRSSMDNDERIRQLEEELEAVRGEKDVLGNQYRTLLGKLTAMRQSLGDKLREDAEELDRRETSINNLTGEIAALQETLQTLQSELVSASQESQNLQSQLAHLRSQSDSSSSDVLSLTREMRELRGEMERLRIEREEWEAEAAKERERREAMEAELTMIERREEEGRREWEKGREELLAERQRADNLQEVLSEFSSAKDGELRQATSELESQLRQAATALSEFKLRAANAETKLGEMSNDASKSSTLSKELKEKNQIIGKLRHDAVVNNEHLTEALRRLRKNSSDNNVDRRLVTNILLQFLTTSRADSKRFEMLNILSTILSWDDVEREKAGLQRMGAAAGGGKKTPTDKGKGKSKREERSAEEEAAMNESFSNLFVEFLLKEAGQGHRPSVSSPGSQVGDPLLSPSKSPPPASLPSWSPPASGANTPSNRPRGMSGSSNTSLPMPLFGRKGSQSLQQALKGDR